jgi:hypothetical protein
MTWLRSADTGMVLALEAARICLIVFGCVGAGWTLGFGMGYRRGTNDATVGEIFKPDHRYNGEA